MTHFDDLMAFARETRALSLVAGRLGWDQETMMPRGAGEQRSEEKAALEGVLHRRRSDPRVGEWLSKINAQDLDPIAQANLGHIRRTYERSTMVPADLKAQIARVSSKSHSAWAEAREANDFASFVPVLSEMVDLKRQEATALCAGGPIYDALLDDYEPGATSQSLTAMFDALRPRLVALRAKALEKPAPKALEGSFDESEQMKLARIVAKSFGYDFKRGRVDKAVHPFSSGSGDDVRITTRTVAEDPFNCLYSTIHEVGHASYEQNVDPQYGLTYLGRGVSMGVHESQSRIYENQIGRSRAYCEWLYGEMVKAFGDFGLADADEFYAAVNIVKKGYIRTEADEVQYNLHVLLRYDLERQLIEGTLEVADLEEAWNARFADDFGYAVDRASNGVLQDVHWAVGYFGYFATYTLGNVFAGCLHQALRSAVPDLDDALAQGNTGPAVEWLKENLQRHGARYEPREVIAKACGFEPSEGPLLDYLEAKFTALYP